MIYKDSSAQYDIEFEPADRAEDCLNCSEDWNNHDGWKCVGIPWAYKANGSRSTNFNDYLPTEKYLTKSMRNSIIINTSAWFTYAKSPRDTAPATEIGARPFSLIFDEPAHQTVKPTIDQWQAWAHNHPGDCACGIKREICDYHK